MTPKLRLLRLAVCALSLTFVCFAIIGGFHGYSPVPFWDMWGATLDFYRRFESDPIRSLFGLHNEHRIVLSRFLFLIDEYAFGGNSAFLVICNYVFAGLIWATFVRCLFRLNPTHTPRNDLWLLAAILAAWLFLWAQRVNFTWAFQSQFFLAQLLPLWAFLSLGAAMNKSCVWNRSFGSALVLGCLSTLSMANGLFVLPLMAAGAIVFRMRWSQVAVIAICACITAGLYLSDYRSPSTHGSVIGSLLNDPLGVLHYTLSYLGNFGIHIAGPFTAVQWLSKLGGLLLLGIAILLTLLTLRKRNTEPVHAGLILFLIFIVAGAFLTAAGRLPFGILSAFSSRYTTPVLMAWAAIFCLASPTLLRAFSQGRREQYGLLIAAISGLSLLLVSQSFALIPKHDLNHQKAVAVLALELGVGDADMVSLIHPNTERALRIAKSASQDDHGLFGRAEYAGLREIIGRSLDPPSDRSCSGRLEHLQTVEGEAEYIRLIGWQHATRATTKISRLLILDSSGRVIGAALLGRPSPYLMEAFGRSGARAGFTGYVRADGLDQPLTVISEACQWKDQL
ncbi:MAG: hypothetical protein AAGL99_08370 [Pseudomonadota bacterium]